MACVFFLICAGILATPWYVVAIQLVVWALVLVVAIAWWSPHPARLPWLPVVLAVAWFGSLVGGARLFGWS